MNDSDNALSGGMSTGPDNFQETQLTVLRNSKAARNALRVVLEVQDEEISALEKECIPISISVGLHSLPDEVIREIFEYGTASAGEFYAEKEFPFHASHVNRRFRSIALETPRIWTRLSNLLPLPQLETYIQRSKNADLSIFVDMYHVLDHDHEKSLLSEFLKITTKHSRRWSYFQYDGDWSIVNDDGEPFEPDLSDYFFDEISLLSLPRLTHLAWNVRAEGEWDSLELFLSECEVPNLVHFDGLNVLLDAPSIGSGLVSCDLTFMMASRSTGTSNNHFVSWRR
ncbi:hypothetical protein BD410DRAFT_54847 [Rickenella mellea]|uniref:F-box domain-containing protein n=1 Tax=Rickenella mellea TaxID=50990 RepID=A0A4R5XG89_9AGAM|nr:hypothetical protein BD410DRAFT_54847 [Rickenella mellea]